MTKERKIEILNHLIENLTGYMMFNLGLCGVIYSAHTGLHMTPREYADFKLWFNTQRPTKKQHSEFYNPLRVGKSYWFPVGLVELRRAFLTHLKETLEKS